CQITTTPRRIIHHDVGGHGAGLERWVEPEWQAHWNRSSGRDANRVGQSASQETNDSHGNSRASGGPRAVQVKTIQEAHLGSGNGQSGVGSRSTAAGGRSVYWRAQGYRTNLERASRVSLKANLLKSGGCR